MSQTKQVEILVNLISNQQRTPQQKTDSLPNNRQGHGPILTGYILRGDSRVTKVGDGNGNVHKAIKHNLIECIDNSDTSQSSHVATTSRPYRLTVQRHEHPVITSHKSFSGNLLLLRCLLVQRGVRRHVQGGGSGGSDNRSSRTVWLLLLLFLSIQNMLFFFLFFFPRLGNQEFLPLLTVLFVKIQRCDTVLHGTAGILSQRRQRRGTL
mmetsp:Transcript_28352/g.47061  ORF Transcript_28352/g.47061 Transcript_28352/m.47061 type:complete len:209 (+) Transcript_28352:2629-3255(+)